MAKEVHVGGQWVPATCSAADLAVVFGISPRAVTNLVAQGVTKPATQQGFFETLPTFHAYLERLRAKAQGRGEGGGLTDERTKGAKVEREIAEHKLAQIRGESLTLAEVGEAWAQFAASIKGAALAVPARARAAIPHLTAHDQEKLREIMEDFLNGLAEEVEVGIVGADDPEALKTGDE